MDEFDFLERLAALGLDPAERLDALAKRQRFNELLATGQPWTAADCADAYAFGLRLGHRP
ncbi:hypothetical protein [Mycolicibacterium fortuitum]|uniref:hypothetical protein n=1 Tax=Mycolicibacterium fortuitum TaxID=1766 RepID=UPI0007EA2256|nr:hypothetical protein [Mycolicibacterium fortuitum]OBG42687.1 hypothetical protein A5670_14925 [Mycolicibacterium fortuitum]